MPLRLSGINSGMDTEGMIKKIMDAERMKLKKVEDKKVTLEWKQDKWKDLNTKLYNLYTKHISSLRLEKAYETKKGNSSNEALAKVEANADASLGDHILKIKNIAKAHTITGGQLQSDEPINAETELYHLGVALGTTFRVTVGKETKSFDVDGATTIKDFVDFAKSAGLNANFDAERKRFYLSAKESGAENGFKLVEDDGSGADDVDSESLMKLGLTSSGGASEIKGVDAVYNLDGVQYTSASNETRVNGLKLTLLGATSDYGTEHGQSIRVGVSSNVEDTYNNFKTFVKEYNELLKEMNKLYYADSARKYKPLSKEEKEAMSEKEIEQWEGKIKDSILRRDDKLGAVLNSMKNALGASVTVGDKKYSLANFGVMTSGYQEKGLLHIFGDSEDGVYASRADKFKKAFSENPDEAGEALKKIMEGLYQKMTDSMKSTGLSSALTFYNDKEYKTLEETYKKQYTRLEDKLKKVEDKYYKQFAAMEKAMAKMNSQTNSLASMLGR